MTVRLAILKKRITILFVLLECSFPMTSFGQKEEGDKWSEKQTLLRELEQAKLGSYFKGMSENYLKLGQLYKQTNQVDSAIFFYEQVLMIEDSTFNTKAADEANAYYQLGNLYRQQSNYVVAVSYYEQGISIAVKNGLYQREASLLNSMGGLYVEIEDYEKGVEYCKKGLDIYTQHFPERKDDICLLLTNIGNILDELGQYEQALFYLNKAAELNAEIQNPYYEALIASGMGLSFLKQRNFEKALTYFETALINARESGDKPSEIAVLANMGQLYMETNEYEKAQKVLLEAYEKAKIVGDQYLRKEVLSLLIKLFSATDDYKRAFQYQETYTSLRDSMLSRDLLIDVANVELKYENSLKEKRILELTVQNQKQSFDLNRNRYLLIIGFSLLALVILTFSLIILRNKLKNASKIHEFENKMFRLQIKPHFIFNVLSSIQGYMNLNEGKKASSYLSKFARLIRNVLEQSRNDFLAVNTEIQNLKYYLELQQMRFEGRFEFDFHVSPEIDADVTLIPPMLVQPIVENSVEHGFSAMDSGGKLDVFFKRDGDVLVVEVIDNGKGLQAVDQLKEKGVLKKESLSLQMIKEQLLYFNKQLKLDCSVVFENRAETDGTSGTKVTIRMPYLMQTAS